LITGEPDDGKGGKSAIGKDSCSQKKRKQRREKEKGRKSREQSITSSLKKSHATVEVKTSIDQEKGSIMNFVSNGWKLLP